MTTTRSMWAPVSLRRCLLALIVLAAAGAIAGSLLAPAYGNVGRWLLWICKPLATVLVLLLAWTAVQPVSGPYRRRITIGLGFCLLGDICLMLPQNLFVPGLACFAVAQLCFIGAFVSDVRFAAKPWPWMGCLAYAVLATWILWASLAADMRLPVMVYVLLLATMAGQALSRVVDLRGHENPAAATAPLAGVGALLFMLSDSLLAWDRFRQPLPLAALWVLATYYAAIGLIACSVSRQAVEK